MTSKKRINLEKQIHLKKEPLLFVTCLFAFSNRICDGMFCLVSVCSFVLSRKIRHKTHAKKSFLTFLVGKNTPHIVCFSSYSAAQCSAVKHSCVICQKMSHLPRHCLLFEERATFHLVCLSLQFCSYHAMHL